LDSLEGRDVDLLVLARGFEDRAYQSAEQLLRLIRPKRILLVSYDETQGERIEDLLVASKVPLQRVTTYDELNTQLASVTGDIVVDTSGLSKAYLFIAVRNVLRVAGHVTLVHTLAERYFPRNEDLLDRGIGMQSSDSEVLSLMDGLLMGEHGPYRLIQVHEEPADAIT
jgi:hypothetical protein